MNEFIFQSSPYYLAFATLGLFAIHTLFPGKKRRGGLFVLNIFFCLFFFLNSPADALFPLYLAGTLWVYFRLRLGGLRSICVLLIVFPFLIFYLVRDGSILPVSPRYWMPISDVLRLLGMPFLLLRSLHMIFERRAVSKLSPTYISIFNYLLYFPTFVSGPFMAYEAFDGAVQSPKVLTREVLYESTWRCSLGLTKQFVLAPLIGYLSIHGIIGSDLATLSFWQILVSLYMYGAYLYLNFSGYTDLAIGLSAAMGVECPENFIRPYLSTNLLEFWNRWHRSFYLWVRTYVFFPAGKKIYGLFPDQRHILWISSAAALWLTFVLAGLWHGAEIHFLYYGAYHAAGVSVVILFRQALSKVFSQEQIERYKVSLCGRCAGIFLTFNFVSFGWLFFLNKPFPPFLKEAFEWLGFY